MFKLVGCGAILVAGVVAALSACRGDDDDEGGGRAPASEISTAVSATTAAIQETFPTWIGQTPDGGTVIVVNDGGSTAFRDDVPEPIAIIDDFAATQDCAGIQGERDFWAGMSDDPDVGVRASAYVLYAETKLAEAAC